MAPLIQTPASFNINPAFSEVLLIMAYSRLLLVLSTLTIILIQTRSLDIGVNYGLLGNNLPSPAEVINLCKQYEITKLRLFDPNPNVLEALKGSKIKVSLGIRNEDLPKLAASQAATDAWFSANVQPYVQDVNFLYITVGNEVIPSAFGNSIPSVMQNLNKIIDENKLSIKVTTVVASSVLGTSYPPSGSAFSEAAEAQVGPVLSILAQTGSPLMINVYPYFAYASNPKDVSLDYAVFKATSPVVMDGELRYTNLFDAIVDAFFWATEKQGVRNVPLVVSESGWPSAGNGEFTTPDLAGTYNRNLVKHVLSNAGTPKRPQTEIETFIFAMFNENQKPKGVEQNFGLFYPNMRPVYQAFNSTPNDYTDTTAA